jgi:predicted SAM-dependent methyltransferase
MIMYKKEKILSHINRNGKGLEIGPSVNPIAPKSEGYDVEIIDYLTKEELVRKYAVHGNLKAKDINKIEEVDYVWQGQTYAELTGKNKYYDWIIASHVIEHTTDLIHFVNDCDTLLKDDGVLALVVPDKRCCFDSYRAITGISQVLDSHFSHNKIHTAGTVADYFLNIVAKEGLIAWTASQGGKVALLHSVSDAVNGIDRVRNKKEYLDVHAWVFTPTSFRLIMNDLFLLRFIHLREISFYPTVGTEFFAILGRTGEGPRKERLELLKKIDAEVSVKYTQRVLYKIWLDFSQRLIHYYHLFKRGVKRGISSFR